MTTAATGTTATSGAGRSPLAATRNSALSARAGLHWRGRLVELILPALFPPTEGRPPAS